MSTECLNYNRSADSELEDIDFSLILRNTFLAANVNAHQVNEVKGK